MGDSRGYYHDGAYTAAPDYLSSDEEEEEEGELYPYEDQQSDPTTANRAALLQEAYFTALTTRFTTLRARLRQSPPQTALARLPPEHETHVASFAPKKATFRTWTHRLRHTDPLPAQVAAMDKTSVLRLLRVVLGAKFFRRGCALRARTSRWIWALLARLPDRGELDSDEVGAVRDLGKRAVLVSISREHVVALCEVLGREQVVAFGLSGVLHEIEGRAEEREVEGDGEERTVNEDEIPLTLDVDGQDEPQDAHQVQVNGIDAPTQIDTDLEEGELSEEAQTTPQPQSAGADAPVADAGETDMELEDGELSEDVQTASELQPAGAEAAVADAGEMDMELEDGELSEDGQTASDPPPIGADTNVVDAAETDLDLEEGEVRKEAPSDSAEDAAVAALKARLLSELDHVETWEENPATPPPAASKTAVDDPVTDAVDNPVTDAVNMRATVNMILTVAGEFYGQRDLLVFRDPFGEVPFETDDDDE